MSGGAVRSGERTRWRNGAGGQLVADHLVGMSGVTDDPVTVDPVLGPVRA